MGLIPLTLPPGVYRNGTAYQTQGRWYDANLMRWYERTLRPFGGWVRVSSTNLDGPGRGMIAWRPSDLSRFAAVGVPNSLFVWNDDVVSDISPVGFPQGIVTTLPGVGYGIGPYGEGPYGLSSESGLLDATTWSLDTWGDYLLAVASHDRVLYEWTGNIASPAVAVAGAPSMLSMFVTDERVVVALGAAGDLRKVAWSAAEDNTDWTAAADNFAGDKLLQTVGTVVRGGRVRGGNLIWTSHDVHKMEFIGQPFIYSIDMISDNCGLVAPLAVQLVNGGAFWMGQKNFFEYTGSGVRPIPCDIHDYVFKDINFDQAAQFASGHIAAFGELLFFYASSGSTENDRCVSYNYREQHWNIVGPVARGCWVDVGVFRHPMAVGVDGIIYEHESGWTADGEPILTDRYAQSGPVEFGSGDQIMEGTQVIPDELSGDAQFTFGQRFTPKGPEFVKGPYPSAPYVDARLTGRQLTIKVEATTDTDFRVGKIRIDATPGGGR